jgi:hypothetical protein
VALANDLRNRCSERRLILLVESAEPFDDERALNSGNDRLDGRGFQEARSVPAVHLHIAHALGGPQLAGHTAMMIRSGRLSL